MRRLAAVALLVPLSFLATGCYKNPHQACENAVIKEYEDADKVLQQPTDLAHFCELWNDQPPGIGTP